MLVFDRRGTGMSDQLPDDFTLEQDATDIAAVMDAAGSERAAILGYTGGGALAAQFAADFPERCRALLFYAPIIRTMAHRGYEWASQTEERVERFNMQSVAWGTGSIAHLVVESRGDDERLRTLAGPDGARVAEPRHAAADGRLPGDRRRARRARGHQRPDARRCTAPRTR